MNVINPIDRQTSSSKHVVVLGLGCVGLTQAVAIAGAGITVTGVDIDAARVTSISKGCSHTPGVSNEELDSVLQQGFLRVAEDVSVVADASHVVLCLPTATPSGYPSLVSLERGVYQLEPWLRKGQVYVLESSVPPGTTRRLVLPAIERTGLRVGHDLFLAYAPERIDPGLERPRLACIPKLVGGITNACTERVVWFYRNIVEHVVPVANPEVAETAKVLENAFRFVNISLVNEMAVLCHRIGVDIWDVIDAAATKPFGFMPHYPSSGVGGVCIPTVPLYLEEVAAQSDCSLGLIEAASMINARMPCYVVERVTELLRQHGRQLEGSRVLAIGVTYKPDVADMRNAPAQRVLELLAARGSHVQFHDPLVPSLQLRQGKLENAELTDCVLAEADCVVILTPHTTLDYRRLVDRSALILDTRNTLASLRAANVVRL